MYSLPEKQDKLLKMIGELDAQERAGINPVRNNIIAFLIVLIWIMGIVGFTLNFIGYRSDGLVVMSLIVIVLSGSLILSYYNLKIGYYLSILSFAGVSGYLIYYYGPQNIPLTILFDSITIFVYANLFGRNGYIVGSVVFVAKALSIYLFFQQDKTIETIIAEIVNMLAIGIIPVLLLSISQVSRRAKKQEIRAEILALQNQELVGSWGTMLGGANQKVPLQVQNSLTQTAAPIPNVGS